VKKIIVHQVGYLQKLNTTYSENNLENKFIKMARNNKCPVTTNRQLVAVSKMPFRICGVDQFDFHPGPITL
jgi:hypothetical protein